MPLLSEQDAEFLKKDFKDKLKNNIKLSFLNRKTAVFIARKRKIYCLR
jgi:hypothetical protein